MQLWPKSLKGQMMLAVAVALLLAQGFHATLLYRALWQQGESAMINAAAMRLLASRPRENGDGRPVRVDIPRSLNIERTSQSPLRPGERHNSRAEQELRRILEDQTEDIAEIMVTRRAIADDAEAKRRLARRFRVFGPNLGPMPDKLLVVGVRNAGDPQWRVVRVLIPAGERNFIAVMIGQTVLIYGALCGAIALILRRITKPLATLTSRVESFAETRDPSAQIVPQGLDDVRRLIVAHNAMEGRITALLDEKDVMLGAIGHDLKTPLAALRVRIESVEDDAERSKMAATIADITRSLDDILSLARTAHQRGPGESTELSALLSSLVDEYEDLGAAVTMEDSQRLVVQAHPTWLKRALRNLIDNALRYGNAARVSVASNGTAAVFRVEDDGPGIAEADMARMQEPFTRGEPSRNSETGGAGLGLALARAIAEQHRGALSLTNRRSAGTSVAGLSAELRLPLR
jgi:signal transduction histidine kinase